MKLRVFTLILLLFLLSACDESYTVRFDQMEGVNWCVKSGYIKLNDNGKDRLEFTLEYTGDSPIAKDESLTYQIYSKKNVDTADLVSVTSDDNHMLYNTTKLYIINEISEGDKKELSSDKNIDSEVSLADIREGTYIIITYPLDGEVNTEVLSLNIKE